jgi:FkbM family methyltransferase
MTAQEIARACLPRSARNWLRAPRQSASWLWHEVRYRAGGFDIVEPRPGWRVRSHPAAYPLAYHAQCDDPEQVREFDAFIATCRPGMILFDIGAHFGIFSLAAIHYGGAEARAIAVDPSELAGHVVRAQAELNGVADRLEMIEAAAGAAEGFVDLLPLGMIASGYLQAASGQPVRELKRIPAVTIDGLSMSRGLIPTHVKIDVEGSELAVLLGARGVIARARPIILIELHNQMVIERGGDPAATLAELDHVGYQIWSLDGGPIQRADILRPPLIRVMAWDRPPLAITSPRTTAPEPCAGRA